MDNILYITELVDIGGGERSLLSLIENLDKTRFRPVLLAPKRGPFTDAVEKLNGKLCLFPFGAAKKIAGAIPLVSLVSISRMWRLLKRENIALVHSNCFIGIVFACIPAKLLGIPLVWTVHGWSSADGIQGTLLNYFIARIITVSSAVKRFITKDGKIPPEKIELVFLGIDLKRYERTDPLKIKKEFAIAENAPVIGMVGRFQAVKGHPYFIEAAKEIKKEVPGCKFLLVGARLFDRPSDRGYPDEIRRMIVGAELENDVILTGFREDVPDILSSLNVLAFPSLRESFGLVVVEAMAVGVPVVSSRCEGPEDIIEDGITGLFVPTKDSGALSTAIVSLLKDPARARFLASTAKARVTSVFDIKAQAKKIENIYAALTEKKR